MESLINRAIQTVETSRISFFKFITPNDVGATGAHQSGYHLHKNAWRLFLSKPGVKGENNEKFVVIKWQNDFETNSRFIYYGIGTRNEYRLTRFGKNFPYLTDENIGDLLIICKVHDEYFKAFVLNTEEEIEQFVSAFSISPIDSHGLIDKFVGNSTKDELTECFLRFVKRLNAEFPGSNEIAEYARRCLNVSTKLTDIKIKNSPDNALLSWIEAEYNLFKLIENERYSEVIKKSFRSVEELVIVANTILNRRKARAGRSLEIHLGDMFDRFQLRYEAQPITEDNKRPDFLFPGVQEYTNPKYENSRLIMLAAKTTCKDRWRQILTEADRIKVKHLFTIQKGISRNQLNEMYKQNVCLVVPSRLIETFPQEFRGRILTLETFINFVRRLQLE